MSSTDANIYGIRVRDINKRFYTESDKRKKEKKMKKLVPKKNKQI